MYKVTRQRYWNGQLGIEISGDVCSDDRLDTRYRLQGEGRIYATLAEAVDALVRIHRIWETATDEPIMYYYVKYGPRDGYEGDAHWLDVYTIDELRDLAYNEKHTPYCGNCRSRLPIKSKSLWDDNKTKRITPECCSVECLDEFIERSSAMYMGQR